MGLLRLTATAAATALGAWLLAGQALTLTGGGRVEDVVALGAVATGALVAAWYALTAATLALARAVRLTRRAPRLAAALGTAVHRCGAPVLRRAAIVGAGAGIALSTLPASAGAPDDAVPHDLRPGLAVTEPAPGGWDAPSSAPPADDGASEPDAAPTEPDAVPMEPAPIAEETVGSAEPGGPPTAAPPPAVGALPASSSSSPLGPSGEAAQQGAGTVGDAHGARRAAPSGADTRDEDGRYVVRRGDSLWSVAAAHLGPDARDPDIAAEWPRWYATNRAVVGADPDLIHPGQVLQAPDPKDVP